MGYDEDLAEELKANTGPKKASQTEMKWLNRLNGMVETALGVIEVRGTTTVSTSTVSIYVQYYFPWKAGLGCLSSKALSAFWKSSVWLSGMRYLLL